MLPWENSQAGDGSEVPKSRLDVELSENGNEIIGFVGHSISVNSIEPVVAIISSFDLIFQESFKIFNGFSSISLNSILRSVIWTCSDDLYSILTSETFFLGLLKVYCHEFGIN